MNAILGIIRYKKAMKKLKKIDVFTKEGYQKCVDALQFMPAEAREGFMAQFVLVVTQM